MRTYFLGWVPKDGEPIRLNSVFHMSTMILQFVVASAAEAELDALYHNCQTGINFWLALTDIGHLQPNTLVHCNNATAVGIANNTIKRQRSGSMEMRFFWVGDKCMTSNGTQGKETLPITNASTPLVHTTQRCTHGTYTWKIPPGYYPGQWRLALWKGLLQPSRMGTYVTYPYLGLHGSRALVMWLVSHIQIPVTHRNHVFPRGVILLDH